jgi:hypothetical protein
MSAPVSTAPQWSAEVLEYARANGLEQYLQSLWQVLLDLFPQAHRMRAYVEQDPELREVRSIALEVWTDRQEIPDSQTYVNKYQEWNKKLFELCPAPLVNHFVLLLEASPNGSP